MNSPVLPRAEYSPSYPRYFKIAGHWINSYKVLLCVGLYIGTLVCAAVGQRFGIPPLRLGLGAMTCGLLGIAGARIYHVLMHARHYRSWAAVRDARSGGMGLFGALITVVPSSWVLASWLHMPWTLLWDCMAAGITFGGFWIRLGCVFNGCCGGRETTGRYGVCLHDTRGVRKRRIPVQFMEMAWWLIGGLLLICLLPRAHEAGSCALGVLAWYGLGRFWLEPLRENPDVLVGKVLVNQVVAALLFVGAGGALLLRTLSY
jgi:prolipoprotein diacylglyceryltransferase